MRLSLLLLRRLSHTACLLVHQDRAADLPIRSSSRRLVLIYSPNAAQIARFAKQVTAPRAETSVRLIPSRLEETAASDEEYYLKVRSGPFARLC